VLLGAKCDPPPPPDCTVHGSTATRDVRYAASPGVAVRLQSLDLYRPVRDPKCAPTPLVVYVHGGGFANGDKANNIGDKVRLFTDAGWSFASLNYRLVGDPGSGPTNGVYPAAEQDIASAVAFLQDHASAYAIDAKHTMLLGHSAGAFLVSLVSTDGSFLQGAGRSLDDIVCTAPLDTRYDIGSNISDGGPDAEIYRNAFGDDPAVWRQGSPLYQVAAGKSIPSFHIVTRGTAIRIGESQKFGSALRDAGVAADVQVATGLTHEDVNDAVGKPGDTVITPPLMSFFRECLT
jgi:acetyl esterase/lipase